MKSRSCQELKEQMKPSSSLLVLGILICMSAMPSSHAFISTSYTLHLTSFLNPKLTYNSISSSTLSSSTTLNAKTKKGKSKSSGGGFGSNTKNKSSVSSQVRSVSGYTGSGTKPLRVAANTFDALRSVYGKTATSDVYVRSPLNDEELCWFVGKVVRNMNSGDSATTPTDNGKDAIPLTGTTIPTVDEALISQKRLILEYAKNQLRPQNFAGPYQNALELWVAPGDSEMDVVQNKISLEKVTGSTQDLSEGFSVQDVGFNPEIYVGEEVAEGGLRVKRDADGHPIKAVFEIQ